MGISTKINRKFSSRTRAIESKGIGKIKNGIFKIKSRREKRTSIQDFRGGRTFSKRAKL